MNVDGDRNTTQPNSTEKEGVTVVIATRDRPALLRRALDAILTQDYVGPIHVVVVFDRSDPEAALELEGLHRSVSVTTNVNTPGLAGARNSGIAAATTPWIAFCDDDDEWLPGKLTAQMHVLAASPECRFATTGVLINYEGKDTARIPDPTRVNHHGFLLDRMTEVHPSSFVAESKLLRSVGGIDEELPGGYAEDYDLLLRISDRTDIAVVSEPMVRIYWHGASFFFERWKMIDDALAYLVAKHPDFQSAPAGLARVRGQQAVAQAAIGERSRSLGTVRDVIGLNWREPRWAVALLVNAGVPANRVLSFLHRFGKGI